MTQHPRHAPHGDPVVTSAQGEPDMAPEFSGAAGVRRESFLEPVSPVFSDDVSGP
jgi:hypothetical protein